MEVFSTFTQMKNQAMKLTLESTADTLHKKDNKLK